VRGGVRNTRDARTTEKEEKSNNIRDTRTAETEGEFSTSRDTRRVGTSARTGIPAKGGSSATPTAPSNRQAHGLQPQQNHSRVKRNITKVTHETAEIPATEGMPWTEGKPGT
jgi:hypothetical protein